MGVRALRQSLARCHARAWQLVAKRSQSRRFDGA
jgi:hypothetical protein